MTAKERLFNERYNEEDEQKERELRQNKSLTEDKRGMARDYVTAHEHW